MCGEYRTSRLNRELMTTVAPSFRAHSDGDSGILDASRAELVPFNVPSLMKPSVCYSKPSVAK